MIKSRCEWCKKSVSRRGFRPARFCSLGCKAEWQKSQKPVDRDWLYRKYVTENLSTYDIAKLVDRDPKRVHEWLVDLGIPTRKRGWKAERDISRPHQLREWLRHQYVDERRPASDIAAECGVTENNILYFLGKFGIPRRDMVTIRKHKKWGNPGALNGMFGKRGAEVAAWKGGITPERQAFYSSLEWKEAVRVLWQRDRATCQRCAYKPKERSRLQAHHIASFSIRELRADLNNLVLLCQPCHKFVHSRLNTEHEFIR